ncbi:hypothetical protein ACCT15_16265 [Rhizobium ruizarguesonis]
MSKLPDIAGMDKAKRSQLRANAERLREKGSEAQKFQAAAALDELRRIEEEEKVSRRATIASLKMPERVANAFTELPPTETERRLLQVLLDNPGGTSEALSAAIQWKGQTWHMHFGEMCKDREHLLWAAEPSEVRDASFFSGILAVFSDLSRGWTIKPEVAEGLAMISIVRSRR